MNLTCLHILIPYIRSIYWSGESPSFLKPEGLSPRSQEPAIGPILSCTNPVGLYIVTCQRFARQRLDKHPVVRARNNKTNVYSFLLGNSHFASELAG
jgi:hypothetical protein